MPSPFEELRLAELDAIRALLPARSRVLELGGARGLQAAALAASGFEVISVDLDNRDVGEGLLFPVVAYDGVHIPFPDEDFDVVFSSNVLEHVTALPELLHDVRRVLRPDGMAVHLLPSPAWRIWTTLGHYVYGVRLAAAILRGQTYERIGHFDGPSAAAVLTRRSWQSALRRAAMPGPHGEFPSALHELVLYRRPVWRRIFELAGFEIIKTTTTGIFYDGYGLFPRLSLGQRRRLAPVAGAACNVFVMRKGPAASRADIGPRGRLANAVAQRSQPTLERHEGP